MSAKTKPLTLKQIKEAKAKLEAEQAEAKAKLAEQRKAQREASKALRDAEKARKAQKPAAQPVEPATSEPQQHSVERTPELQAAADAAFMLPYEAPAPIALDPTQELAMRELCRRRLLPFIKRFRPKYLAGWVHADICRRIERFVEQVERGEEPRLLLMMPPRSGKSEISSRHTPAWILGKHPDWEIIAASHTSSLTMSFSRYLRDLMRDPSYQVVFEESRLDPSSQSVENWSLTRGGGYLAAGVGTGITGRGAHVLLLDDLVKDMEAADSQTIRDNTWEWYLSTAYTRLAPGGGVLGLMTWWHDDDWAGRIQEAMREGGDQFEIIRYPAINEEGDEYILADDTIVQIPPQTPVPDGARMTRPQGTAVHPARYTTQAMQRIKNNLIRGGQKRVWDALYQQNPIPDEGNFFGKDMFRYYGTAPARSDLFIYQAWDFAISEKQQSDYNVGITIGQDHRDYLYVLDVRRFKTSDGELLIETVVDYAQFWNVDLLGCEDGQIWKSLASTFERVCGEKRYYPSFEVLTPLTDKMVRAGPARGRMQAGRVYFDKEAAWFRELYKEFLHFPAGKHDDQVDALAWAIRLSLTRFAPKPKEAPKVKSWKDKLPGMGAVGGSHMAA